MVGKVKSTQPDDTGRGTTVNIIPTDREYIDSGLSELPINAVDLAKHFTVGCHVKCVKGKWKDETGLLCAT